MRHRPFVRVVSMLLAVVLLTSIYPVYPSRSGQQIFAQESAGTEMEEPTVTSSSYDLEPLAAAAAADKFSDYGWEKIESNIKPSPRMGAAMAFDEKNGKVIMFGGEGTSGLLKDNFLWDGETKQWQKLADSSVPSGLVARKGAAITYDPNLERLVMFGGEGASGVLNDIWVWHGEVLQWKPLLIPAPSARAGAQFAYDGQNLVLFGGYTLSGSTKNRLADTWIFNGTSWEQRTPAQSPPATYSGSMAYDGQYAVLYGGNIGDEIRGTAYQINSNTLWAWDGTTWNDSAPKVEAQDWGRWGQAMAYDGRRVVFYGGEFDWINPSNSAVTPNKKRPIANSQDAQGKKAAFGWDGSAWSIWSGNSKGPGGGIEGGPGSGSFMSMAYDGYNFVVFGGNHEWGGLTNETFTFGNPLPTLPIVSITGLPTILMDKNNKANDLARFSANVKGKALSEIGIEYREAGQTTWQKKAHLSAEAGAVTIDLNGLKWQVDYEARVYATNVVGTAYSAVSTFKFFEDPAMVVPDLRYDRASPSVLHTKDKKRLVVVGEGITNLWRKPASNIHYSLKSQGGQLYPLTPNVRNDQELELNWTDELPDGKYDLELNHDFYDDFVLSGALLITSTGVYEPRDYNEIIIPSTDSDNEDISQMAIRGPFTENPSELGIFKLNNMNQVVMLNEYIKFKGTSLTIDKTGVDTYVTGVGRLYVEKAGIMYTLFLGSFEFNSAEFVIELAGDMQSDYLSLNLPITLKKITFIAGGVRLGGDIKVDFSAGTTKIKGESEIEALEFKRERFDFAGKFSIAGEFEAGPLEGAELNFRLDTRIPLYGAGGSFDLRKQKVGFEADIQFKRGKLDALSFGVRRKIKLGSTGAQLTRLGGGFSNLASQSEVPFTLKAFGGASDVIAPEIKGYNMVNGNNLSVGLSRYHFEASGELAVYWVPVANLDFLTIWNAAGFKEYSSAGFRLDANLNLVDVVVGQLFAQYFANSGYAGFVSARIKIPNWVSVIGGKSFGGIDVGVNNREIFGSVGSGWFGGSAKYMFAPNSFDFSLGASKDMKREIERMKRNMVKPPSARSMPLLSSSALLFTSAFADTSFTPLTNPLLTEDKGYMLKLQKDVLQQGEIGVDTAASGRILLGQFTAALRENSPQASFTKQDQIQYTLQADHSFKALLVLDGKQEDLSIIRPDESVASLKFPETEKAGNGAISAVYREDEDKTYIRLQLTANEDWKLAASQSLQVELYELTFLNESLSLTELAARWAAAPELKLTAIDMMERGLKLVELDQPKGAVKLYKPDGREYGLESDSLKSGWNHYVDPLSGKLYLLIDVAQPGEWLLEAGQKTPAKVFALGEHTTTRELKDWITSGELRTEVNLKSGQTLLEIDQADETAVLYRPDGSPYPLQADRSESNWNAYYEADKQKWTILVQAAEEEAGLWTVRGKQFVTIRAFRSDEQYDSLIPFFSNGTAEYTTSLQIDKPGRYMFMLTGGSRNTQIIAPDNKAIPVVFEDENAKNYNAVLQAAVAKEDEEADKYGDMTFTSNLPFVADADMLYVAADIEQTGKWEIRSSLPIQASMYELDPVTEISEFSAVPETEGTNRFKVKWNVDHAKQGTKVSLMVTDQSNKAIGPVILKDLPASGIQTIDIPDEFMPGQYWLSMVAEGEEIAPLFAVTSEPVQLTAEVMLPQPKQLAITSTGNGELTLRFPSIKAEGLEYYQLTVSYKDDEGKTVTDTFGADPMAGDWQDVIISGYKPEHSYTINAMAVGEQNGKVVVSPVSANVEAFLPNPKRAKLNVAFNTFGAKQKTSTYKSYDEQEEIMVNTAAEKVSVELTSDQAAKVNLYVNGELLQSKDTEANTVASFNLNELLLGKETNEPLEQLDYTIEIEAVNERGDYSSDYRKLYVDRTEPFLYVAGKQNEDFVREPLNGQVVYGSRIPMVGQTEIGALLTVDGRAVPVNAEGKFNYFAPIVWDETGLHTVIVEVEDEVGNRVEYRFDVVQGTETAEQSKVKPSDLAALELDKGVLSQPFHPDLTGRYETVVEEGKVRLYAVAAAIDSIVTVNNVPLNAQGYAELEAPIGNGVTTAQVKVSGADTSEKTYVIELRSKPSEVAVLKSLTMRAGTEELLTEPAFNGADTDYSVFVENNTNAVSVAAEAYKQGSTIRVNGELLGEAGISVPVQVGETHVAIQVIAPNGQENKTYNVKVIRAKDSNAQLKDLTVSGGVLTRDFAGNEMDYQIIAPSDSAALSFAVEAASPSAVIRIADGGIELGSGGTHVVPLRSGTQPVQLDVTAEDGTVATYKLAVIKQSASAAAAPSLTELSIAGLDLLPAFSASRLSYKLKSEIEDANVSVLANISNSDAILTINGRPAQKGVHQTVSLKVGTNLIVIGVESADRSSSRQYSIEIVRKPTYATPDRLATVASGDSNAAIANVTITRTVARDGSKIDTVNIPLAKAEEIVAQMKLQKQNAARIVITNLLNNPSDEIKLNVPSKAVAALAESGISLVISTPTAELTLSPETIHHIKEAGIELYLRFVPIRDQAKQQQIHDRLLGEANLKKQLGGRDAELLGQPTAIETNYKDSVTRIVLPIAGLETAKDSAAAKELEAQLAVYIEHSDGAKVLQSGRLQYDTKGIVNGMAFDVAKFSNFAVVKLTKDKLYEPYVTGYPDGTFRPSKTITRAELAVILAKELKKNASLLEETAPNANETELPAFSDVVSDHWAKEAITLLRNHGIMNGDEQGKFRPGDGVSRSEIAVIAARWNKLSLSGTAKADFTDLTGHWATNEVAAVAEAGFMKGYPDHTFRPNGLLLRGEAVRALNAIFNRPVPQETVSSSWPDVAPKHWAMLDIEAASRYVQKLPDGQVRVVKTK
ncbi:cadherin-like beta sandwich domain-containing protein [Paenibacillus sp. TAF43_2]|uniref:cadherin-like beta sandwich domain-containing protein n=1 Tax=Paenibacillus sp. TAF43_2 TaxID=3233069 RepID=UPI003F96BA3F